MKKLFYALAGVTLGLLPALSAGPLYVSSTSAYAAGGGGVGGIGYNGYNETQFGFLSSNVGYGVYGGSCASNAAQPCSVTLSGPTDPTGLLTSSSNSASALGTACAGFNPVCLPSDGTSSATADLSQGKIGVYASGNSAFLNGTDAGGSGESHAQIGDMLNFTVAGGNTNTVTQIVVTFTVTGSLFGSGNAVSEALAEMISGLSFGNGAEQFVTIYPDPHSTSTPSYSDSASGWVSYSFTGAQAAGGYQFTGIYQFTGASAEIPVGMGLDCYAAVGTTCDYSHTGLISLSLPNGVSYTSASGVFLTNQASAVPEPASLSVAGLGLMLLAGAAYRRRK